MNDITAFFAGLILATASWLRYFCNVSESHSDIVKHGAAYWHVDAYGNTTFKWNDQKERPKGTTKRNHSNDHD